MASVGLAWILLASGFSLYNYHFVPRHMKGVPWQSFVQRLVECSRPGDILIQNYPDPALPYYLQDQVPRILLPADATAGAPATETKLRRLPGKYERIWLQPQQAGGWDRDAAVETWMDLNAWKVAEEKFANVRLALYLPVKTLEPMLSSPDVLLGGSIRLQGFGLRAEGTGGPRRVRCGVLCRQRRRAAGRHAGSDAAVAG